MKKKRLIVILHFFVGIGAMGGGTGALLDPSGKLMGLPEGMLVNGPFTDFFIPGLFLFFALGVCNIISGTITIRRWVIYPYANIAMGGMLCLWIIIQCYMLFAVNYLHVLFFMIGLVQLLLACVQAWRMRIFPLNLLFGSIKGEA